MDTYMRTPPFTHPFKKTSPLVQNYCAAQQRQSLYELPFRRYVYDTVCAEKEETGTQKIKNKK